PYAIYDGSTLLTTVIVDQRLGPTGTTVGGVVFQDLAVVQATSGTLRVVLSDNVDGYIVADAIRIVPASPPAGRLSNAVAAFGTFQVPPQPGQGPFGSNQNRTSRANVGTRTGAPLFATHRGTDHGVVWTVRNSARVLRNWAMATDAVFS